MADFIRHAAYQRLSGADTLVLFAHGIQGSPNQFTALAAALPENIDYLCLLLPGHGNSVREFRHSSAHQWRAYFDKTCREMHARYRRVVFVGHSMGCLLGILAETEHAAHFSEMLLLACPLRIRITRRYLLNNWRSAAGTASAETAMFRAANSVHARHPIEYLSCIRPYLGLLRLIRTARRCLPNLDCPVTVVHSDDDEIVSSKMLALFPSSERITKLIVPESGHFIYSEAATRRISAELAGMLKPSGD